VRRDMGAHAAHFRFVIDRACKPDPTVYLDALRMYQLSASACAYVGDACSDVVLAKRAGSQAIAMLSGMGTAAQLRRAQPALMFASLEELVVHFCGGGRVKGECKKGGCE
jgi:phosphoglycolate phosphatase-like HAD superfamily hydrolase